MGESGAKKYIVNVEIENAISYIKRKWYLYRRNKIEKQTPN